MSTALHSSSLTTEKSSIWNQQCSMCSSIAHFACIDHCETVLCARCTSKHRADVIKQMRELLKKINLYQMKLAVSTNVTGKRSTEASYTLEHSFYKHKDFNETAVASNSLESYVIILNEYLEKDQLLNAKSLIDLEMRLNEQMDQSKKNSVSLMTSENIDANKFILRRSRPRPQTTKSIRSKKITVSLNTQLTFAIPVERSFSVGQHPIAVSLGDTYLETFFCQGRDNGVILLSSLSIDVYTRSSGLTWSIPINRVLGNTKDKILAGVWCSYYERLILAGKYHFYLFDMDRQKIKCICKCGCGARCMSGTLPPKPRHNLTPRYRYQPTYDDHTNSQRFLATNNKGLLFYAYKSGLDTYRIETLALTIPSDGRDQEHENSFSIYDSYGTWDDKEIKLINALSVEGQLAAIYVSQDRLAFVYRRFSQIENSSIKSRNSLNINHYFALFNHSLKKLTNYALLPSSIRWLTAMLCYGIESKYLLCDPRSQQLLLYQAVDNVLIRRFHIGPVNACCLSDGRLALWIQKAYSSSPIGKLHFISTPHLEKYAVISTSFELLNTSHN